MRNRIESALLLAGPLVLVLWALLVNEWAVAYLFTSDNQIDSTPLRAALALFDAGLIVAALLTFRYRHSKVKRPLAAGHLLLILASPALLWALWTNNPNRHHWHRPLSPQEALARMTVPEGFRVELVAAEPDLVNPVAMAFDTRGRIWVAESVEYPHGSTDSPRDRIKVLEDTDGDGAVDRTTIFADGLNMPTGIAVGYGGVWVANAPDILFLEDRNGDGRADHREVVVTGFGQHDSHELPNTLTWGPDGWLYGLNGIMNPSRVRQGGREFQFSCAMFRIHPRTRKFEIFAEGTSNPWGIAWDGEGSVFVSACVIDHLWHLVQSGYYQTQSGRYPENTWPIHSIVNHKHQQAAYCGLEYFDSDAYPAAYRERLYLGNIHGGCLNVERLERDGATYVARPEPDFFTANDGWFMPVSVKTGPDGSLYVLDWYDRYHCHQDAQRDPDGVDRLRGRLYRIRYGETPRYSGQDLANESNEQLVELLFSANVFMRRTAARLLSERLGHSDRPETRERLRRLVLDPRATRKGRMQALWALIGGGPLAPNFHLQLLTHNDASLRAWGVRAAGNQADAPPEVVRQITALAADEMPEVRLQVAIASTRLPGVDPIPLLVDVLKNGPADKLLARVAWQNLHPRLATHNQQLMRLVQGIELQAHPNLALVMPRVVSAILAGEQSATETADLLVSLLDDPDASDRGTTRAALRRVAGRIVSQEIAGEEMAVLRERLEPAAVRLLATTADEPLQFDMALVAAGWNDPAALDLLQGVFMDQGAKFEKRRLALDSLVAAEDAATIKKFDEMLLPGSAAPPTLQAAILDAMARLDQPSVANVVLAAYPTLDAALQPRAIELLTGRLAWSRELVSAIERGEIPSAAINLEQVRKLQAMHDEALAGRVKTLWGEVRTQRDPQRERVIAEMRRAADEHSGNAERGRQVFVKLCAQCHKIFGQGHDVGPDLTRNGRKNLVQLLSNVFDPNLVVGNAYRTRLVLTNDGRVLTGLLVEDTKQRITLKLPGGRREQIPRDQIDEMLESEVSLMPEGLERQMTSQEVADLVAFLLNSPTEGVD